MTIADHIGLGLGLGLGLVTALGGPDLRNGGPSEWRTQIDELKAERRLIDVWHHSEQSDIDDSVDQWRKCLCP